MRAYGTRPARSEEHWVESSFTLSVGLLAGRSVEPGLEDRTELHSPRCAWTIPCRYIVRRPEGLVLTVVLGTWPQQAVHHVELTTARLASGGDSYYFRCPGLPSAEACGRRVRHLHLPVFGTMVPACRRCHGLGYRSQCTRVRTFEQIVARFERMKARIGYPGSDAP